MNAAEVRAYIAEHAGSPEGISPKAMVAMGGTNNGVIYTAIKKHGALHVGKRWRDHRYFLHAEHAAAHENDGRPRKAPKPPRVAKPKLDAPAVAVVKPGADLTPFHAPKRHAKWAADAPAIITSATKVTIAPPMPDCYRSNTWSTHG